MQMEYIRVPEARARQIPAAVPLPARDSRRWISSDEFEQLLSLNLPEQATAVIERGTNFKTFLVPMLYDLPMYYGLPMLHKCVQFIVLEYEFTSLCRILRTGCI